jgi:hypothetical protein
MFYPQGGGAAAHGQVTGGGRYELQTGSARGLKPGNYNVTVRVVEIDAPAPGQQGPPASTMLVAPRYGLATTSGLEAHVAEGANQIDFDLEPAPGK